MRYGLPKDWDTIAVFYNADMFEAAGIDPAVMKDWTWNPQDGGTFEETIAKLTLDAEGRNGLDPNFDASNVVQWGFTGSGAGDGGSGGQTDWSAFAASTGFQLTDGPWGTQYHYDDPRVAETLQWWADLHLVKGYAPGTDSLSGADNKTLFFAQKVAMTTDGSWQINNIIQNATFSTGIGMLPAGPEGAKSPINGLSDAIWSGTQHPEEAWQWVKFLASTDCANIVGDFGVVFPAIQSGVDKALAAHSEKGADVSAFTDIAALPNATYLLPITDHGSEVTNLANPVLVDIFDGKVTAADALPQLNQDINALFE
jgi:multiple sugar transport system substrate-binding protein